MTGSLVRPGQRFPPASKESRHAALGVSWSIGILSWFYQSCIDLYRFVIFDPFVILMHIYIYVMPFWLKLIHPWETSVIRPPSVRSPSDPPNFPAQWSIHVACCFGSRELGWFGKRHAFWGSMGVDEGAWARGDGHHRALYGSIENDRELEGQVRQCFSKSKSWELTPPGDYWMHWTIGIGWSGAFGPGADELHFCGKADCVAGLDSLTQEYGSCYAGTLCKSITEQNSKLDYSKCRNVLQAWMPRAFRTQQYHLCEKEGDVYCNEVVTSVMLQQSTLTCWEMFYKTGPAAVELCRAKPDCVEPWKIEQRKFPKCVKLLENQIKEQAEQSMGMARELLMTAKEPEVRHAAENWRPKSLSTFMEVCLSEAHMMV